MNLQTERHLPPPYPAARFSADELHIIARRIEESADPKVREAAWYVRRAADLLYEATKNEVEAP